MVSSLTLSPSHFPWIIWSKHMPSPATYIFLTFKLDLSSEPQSYSLDLPPVFQLSKTNLVTMQLSCQICLLCGLVFICSCWHLYPLSYRNQKSQNHSRVFLMFHLPCSILSILASESLHNSKIPLTFTPAPAALVKSIWFRD